MHRRWVGVSLLLIILWIGAVSAEPVADVAYVLGDNSQVSNTLTSKLAELGLSYGVVTNSEVPSTDFSDYSLMLIAENIGNKENLSFGEVNAIFFDKEIAPEVWDIRSSSYSTNSRSIKVEDINSFVFENVTIESGGDVKVYSQFPWSRINRLTLNGNSGVHVVASSGGFPAVVHSEKEINGASIKDLFMGIPDVNKWSDNTKKMFQNSVLWLIGDIDQDGDGFTLNDGDCNDLDAGAYPGADELPYDGIDQDCDGSDWTDVDNDGYNSSIVGGLDCVDTDPAINPGNPDPLLNCINDAPEITGINYGSSYFENEMVIVEVLTTDPEGDDLVYSVDDPRFTVNGNALFWQTTYDDAGEYTFTVNVSDSEFSDSEQMTIEIIDTNRPPVSIQIPDIAWGEDLNYSINLRDYFSDDDGNSLSFGVEDTSNDTNIDVSLDGEMVFFSSKENWFGSDWIIFYAFDGEDKTVSNKVVLNVIPVNDPVEFSGPIGDLQWNEDNDLVDAIDLYDYFTDPDSELTFEVSGNVNIRVVIENGKVSFFPDHDFFGQEQISFTATDSQYSDSSNVVVLTVNEMGEPPVLSNLTCETEIEEDVANTCVLEAWDLENDTLTFSASGENNLNCEISGNVLTYVSEEDYFGIASCVVVVSDVDGSDSLPLEVNISPVNDRPEITSYLPSENTVVVVEGQSQEFSIEIEDVDSNASVLWILNGQTKANNSLSYLFFENVGRYSLQARVSDSELSSNRNWNVVVGPVSDFTCSEVGGFVLSEKETCDGEILGVKDTNSCCSVAGAPGFNDADSCQLISKDIKIKINEPGENDKQEIGETMNVDLDIENDFEKDQNLNVEAHLYNLDTDKSEAFVDADVVINEGRSRILKMDLEIPEDLDLDDGYALYVKTEDDVCSQNYVPVDLERPKDKIAISKFDLPNDATCGDVVDARVRVENIGSEKQDVALSLESRKLGLDEKSGRFELEEYNGDDRETKDFNLEIPGDVEPGKYEIKATASFNGKTETATRKIDVACGKEVVYERAVDVKEEKITLGNISNPVKEIVKKKPNYLLVSGIATLDLILIASIIFGYLLFIKGNSQNRSKPSKKK